MNNSAMDVEAYGSARLLQEAGHDVSPVFGESGSTAMPLGYNAGNPAQGMAYDVGPGSLQRGHALTFGRTRGGKGVSAIIPALLTYKGSMVVIDPKGENAWITAERRRQMGQRVVILDPWGEVNRRFGSKVGVAEAITKFNPLSALDPADPEFVDDITAIADAFIFQTGNDPHWSDSARDLTGGLIAAEVQRNPQKASMRSVRTVVQAPIQDLIAVVKSTIEDFPGSIAARKLAAIVEVEPDKVKENGEIEVSHEIANERELASIRSTARTQTSFLDSERLVDSMETDEKPFDLSDLATQRVTLYLVLPVDRLKSHGRWLRMILTLAIRAIAKVDNIPEPPVVFILDELGTISPGFGLSMIEQSYGLMAGLGIRIWAFLQDLPQLKRDYPDSWETFISNSSVIQLLNVADNTTARYFSEFLGNSTVNAKTGSWSLKDKRREPGQSYEQEWLDKATQHCILNGYVSGPWEHARNEIWQHATGKKGMHTSTRITSAVDHVKQQLQERGQSELGKREWSEDTQLMSRPVLFPWEIVKPKDPASCIMLVPGADNYQLKRFLYYAHAQMSRWARPDPNRRAAPSSPPPPPPPPAM